MTSASLTDLSWLQRALELTKDCPNSSVYSVGSILVSPTGERFITGFTGEETYEDGGPISLPHAEEIALKKAVSVADLPAWTLYSTLEPCSERSSGREACATRIINSGIRRVVFGAREPYDPVLKIRCRGESFLRAAGVEVVQISEFEAECLRAAKRLRT